MSKFTFQEQSRYFEKKLNLKTNSYAEGTSAEAIDMDKRVRAYMKEHNVSYVTAFNAIHS